MKSFFVFLIFQFISLVVQARVLYQPLQSTRSLGMGGTSIAMVRGVDSLYMNPAALALAEGYSFTIAEVQASMGLNSTKISSNEGAALTAADVEEFYGNTLFSDASAKSGMIFPNFGFGAYSSNYIHMKFNDPVFPEFNVDFVSDYGYVLAGALPLGPKASFGVAVRHVKRWATEENFLVTDLVGSSSSDFIENNINSKGTGTALDLSFMTQLSGNLNPVLAVVWKDVGSTRFEPTAGQGPNRQDENLIFGASIQHPFAYGNWTHAFEYKYISTNSVDLTKKIHLGTEASFGLIDLRAGLYQGYLTYGAALDFSFIRAEVAAYALELGNSSGQSKSDRYQASLSINLDFDQAFKLTKDGKKRRLMQRR
jgi:hypothetical protein